MRVVDLKNVIITAEEKSSPFMLNSGYDLVNEMKVLEDLLWNDSRVINNC